MSQIKETKITTFEKNAYIIGFLLLLPWVMLGVGVLFAFLVALPIFIIIEYIELIKTII